MRAGHRKKAFIRHRRRTYASLAGTGVFLSVSSIPENSSQGTSIGTLTATFGTGPYTYAVLVDADSKFAIGGGGSDELVTRTGATLNYEVATSHTVTIRATDSLAATEDKVFLITVADVADGPTTTGATTTLEAMVGSPAVGVLVTGDLRDLFVSPTSQALTFVVSHGTIAGDGYTWSWTPATAQAETPSVTATDEDSQELTIDVGVTVIAANQAPSAGDLTLEFAVGEFGNPAISSSSPADNATGVAVAVDPTVTFDRNIVFGASGSIYIYDVTGAAILETFDVATEQGTSPGQVSISTDTLTIHPTSDLTNSNEYAIQWTAGAVESVEGAEVAALSDTTTISFTTIAAAASDVSTHSTLTTGLAEYWDFGEASGNRTGGHNSIVLTDTNTVTSTTGTDGNAALFTAANTEYLTVNDSSHGGNLDITGDLTVSCRFKFTSFPSATSVVLVTKNVGASKSWFMDLEENAGALNLRLSVSSNGSSNTVNGYDIVGSIATGTWCRLTIMYDASAGSAEFFFNTTSLGTRTGFPTSLFNSTADFRVGASNGATNAMDTAAEGLGVWSRLLTTGELSDLHNGNVLLPYAA